MLGEQALVSSEESNPIKRGTPDDWICTFRYCHLVGWDFELQHMNRGTPAASLMVVGEA